MKIEYCVLLRKDLYDRSEKMVIVEVFSEYPLTYVSAKSKVYEQLETICNNSEDLQEYTCISDFWETTTFRSERWT